MRHFSNVRRVLVAVLSASMLMSECLGVSAAAIGEQSYIEETPIQEETEIVSEAEETEEAQNEETSEGLTEDKEEEVANQEESTDDETVDEEESEETTDGASVSDNSVSDNSVSDNEVTEDEELIGGLFPGLALSVNLEDYQLEFKEKIRDHEEGYLNYVEGKHYVEGEIIVKAETQEEAEEFAKAFNGTLDSFEWGIAVIRLNADDTLPQATVMDAVTLSAKNESALPAAFPNTLYYLYEDLTEDSVDVEEIDVEQEEIFEDTLFYDEKGKAVDNYSVNSINNDPMLKPTDPMYQWQHVQLGSEVAWKAGYTGKGIKVYVLDTGIKSDHADLKSNIKGASGINKDGNTAKDTQGHGTHVAGIIAAQANNKAGGCGVAYNASIYSINVFGEYNPDNPDDFGASEANVTRALNRAVSEGADIVNLSLGGPGYSAVYEEDIEKAYKNGVAVFCAAGNESTSGIAYPAGYKGAISIAAVDKNNKKARFSNYGGIAFSGPGVGIFSTYKDGSYYEMDGTSQATPCIAGAAAVILSSGKISAKKGTKERVDQLKSILAKGASSSGLGKGTPHLGKCLGLGTSETAPAAPTINRKPGIYKQKKLDFVLSAPAGTTVYFTTDGSNISYKNGAIVSNGQFKKGTSGSVEGKSSVMIKALAVNLTNGTASKVATFKYTLEPNIETLVISPKTGVKKLSKNASVQMVANITPDYAKNKKLTWGIVNKPEGVTVSGSGMVKVTSKVKVTSFTVFASTQNGVIGKCSFQITDGNIKSIKVSKKSLTVFDRAPGNTEQITVTAFRASDNKEVKPASNYVTAISSDTKVATATLSGNTLTIKGVNCGKAVITLASADGSGKTATVNVNVGLKVTSVSINGPKGNILTVGKTLKLTTQVSPEKATNRKLIWSITKCPNGVTEKTSGIKVNASGVVSASANAKEGAYTVTASSADGAGAKGSYSFNVVAGRITGINVTSAPAKLFRVKNIYGSSNSSTITFNVTGNGNKNAIEVTSSNPDVLRVDSYSAYNAKVIASGTGIGNVTITIATTDGTNIKKNIKILVCNPPSGLRLAAPAGRSYRLAKGKTMTLSAMFETEFGKMDSSSKKLTWESDSSCVSVDQKGRVKALTDRGDVAKITAKATDGSGITATYYVQTVGNISSLTGYYDSVNYRNNTQFWSGASFKMKDESLDIWAVPSGTGVASNEYTINVSGGNGLGIYRYKQTYKVGGVNNCFRITTIFNKPGTYTVTISCTDGNSASAKYKIIVN